MLDLTDLRDNLQDQPYCVTGSMEELEILNNCLRTLNERCVLKSFLQHAFFQILREWCGVETGAVFAALKKESGGGRFLSKKGVAQPSSMLDVPQGVVEPPPAKGAARPLSMQIFDIPFF